MAHPSLVRSSPFTVWQILQRLLPIRQQEPPEGLPHLLLALGCVLTRGKEAGDVGTDSENCPWVSLAGSK